LTTGRRAFDVVVLIEDLLPKMFWVGEKIIFLPNQEWFRGAEAQLPHVDLIWCKSRLAEEIFQRRGCRTHFISFTTEAVNRPEAVMDYRKFLHVAGRSPQKGTRALVAAWLRHPEWPLLTILGDGDWRPPAAHRPANLRLLTERVSEEEKQILQASHGIHWCPSEAEGFGHIIAEGMSAGAVVVTTDAAPMNELVTADRGVLVRPSGRARQGLDFRHEVLPERIEEAVREVLAMSWEERQRRGARAREWFRENNLFFRQTLAASLHLLLPVRSEV
jgi:glycosyltransferase involved in cell wall biosynthesis